MLIDNKHGAIGIFDSGLGGLTVVEALRQHLPCEDVVYYGDTARVPYGTKSRESIIRFSKENVAVLLKYKVKIVIVACNSSSSYALASLKKTFDVPLIDVIDPGVKKAVRITKNKRIGIIATPATIRSQAYSKQIERLDPSIKVFSKACPLFVPLVEEGWFRHNVTRAVAREYLDEIKKARVDTLILGCTHYPLLRPTLEQIMGKRVTLIDSAQEVALKVAGLLEKSGRLRTRPGKVQRFLVSDEPTHFRNAAKRFLGYDIKDVRRVV